MNKTGKTENSADILRGLLQMERRRVIASFDLDAATRAVESDEDHAWRERNTERHPHREIMVILKGDIPFQLSSRIYEGHVGDIVLFDAFEAHDRFHPPGVRSGLSLWLRIGPQGVICYINRIKNGKCRIITRLDFSKLDFATMLTSVWHDAVDDRRLPKAALLKIGGMVDVVMGMLAEKIAHSEYRYLDGGKEVRSRSHLAVMSAMDYICKHIGEEVQFDALAERAGYSPAHFARLFRQYSRYNFRDYLDMVRWEGYKNIQHLRKKEIASALGFSSSSSLNRWLNKVNGKAERLSTVAKLKLPHRRTP